VTGAATGIGAGTVEACANEGAQVAAVWRSSPPPPELADAARWWQCDLRDEDAVNDVFARATEVLGGLDVLLHCAGTWAPSAPGAVTTEDLDFAFDTNLKATVFTNQAAFALLGGRGGAIVNIGSSEGVFGNPLSVAYSMAKAGVHAWTRAAARIWGRHGVTVNSVLPVAETRGMDRLREFVGPEQARAIDDGIAQGIALGRLGDPVTDLGPVMVFLASPASHFITGQLLSVDGGSFVGS
jgi:NAD(P)-dependent dehydrogenase (short-subunit alcohol dehydrogenase family)